MNPYICHVIFFIVLDLRLTKVGVQRYSFFYAHILGMHKIGRYSKYLIGRFRPVLPDVINFTIFRHQIINVS